MHPTRSDVEKVGVACAVGALRATVVAGEVRLGDVLPLGAVRHPLLRAVVDVVVGAERANKRSIRKTRVRVSSKSGGSLVRAAYLHY